jgi:hypothetical protein
MQFWQLQQSEHTYSKLVTTEFSHSVVIVKPRKNPDLSTYFFNAPYAGI